jgi:RNA recognition motif-containing protein
MFQGVFSMSKKLYVGNLPYQTREDALGSLFQEFGSVESVRVITDRQTGRSKGFGFVEMSTEEQAQTAIQKLNQSEFEGRKITVSVAQDKEEGGQRRGGGFQNRPPRRDY